MNPYTLGIILLIISYFAYTEAVPTENRDVIYRINKSQVSILPQTKYPTNVGLYD
tara:strand:- start:1971 stop:2135 length:165 start_codon:yes stop_codon:yes gene_type:complete